MRLTTGTPESDLGWHVPEFFDARSGGAVRVQRLRRLRAVEQGCGFDSISPMAEPMKLEISVRSLCRKHCVSLMKKDLAFCTSGMSAVHGVSGRYQF